MKLLKSRSKEKNDVQCALNVGSFFCCISSPEVRMGGWRKNEMVGSEFGRKKLKVRNSW